jgi:hypothetical protein
MSKKADSYSGYYVLNYGLDCLLMNNRTNWRNACYVYENRFTSNGNGGSNPPASILNPHYYIENEVFAIL